MNSDSSDGQRLLVRIEGEPAQLQRLRAALSEWLRRAGIDDDSCADLVLATHELAAEAIERQAAEVAVLGEVLGDAIRLSVAGGDWSSLEELRSTLLRALVAEIRVHRGIVTMRLNRTEVSRAATRPRLAKGSSSCPSQCERERVEEARSTRKLGS